MMKFTVNQREFSDALAIASKAIISKTPLDILKGFYLEAYENELTITGNNLEIGIRTSIDAFVETEGKSVIDAKILSDIIRKLPNEEVTVSIKDGNVLLQCQKLKFTIKEMLDNGFPTVDELEEAVYQNIHPAILEEMIKKTHFAVTTDETKPVFMGELVELEDNQMNVIALDGFRLAYKKCELKSSVGSRSMIIPGKTMVEIMRLCQTMEEDVKIGIEDRHASFLFGRTLVNTQLIQGEFSKYEEIIPKEFSTKIKVNRQKFIDALDRATLVSKNYLVKLRIQNDELLITAHDNEVGNLEEILDVELEGKNLEIAFNIRFFLDSLKVMEDEYIYMNFNTNVSPCIIKPEFETDYTYLVLPVRI